jgi:hypothetical protein
MPNGDDLRRSVVRPSIQGIRPLLKHVLALCAVFRSVVDAGNALDRVAESLFDDRGIKPSFV